MSTHKHIGTRWYKCDLHLHTPESKCFKDRDTVTAEQWVQEALDKRLDCVAVTDHNSGNWVDQIKEAAKDTALTVFPGVEITCSDAKVHLLILFDTDKTSQDVYDFLIKADLESKDFADQLAHTDMKLRDVATLANERGAIVIPAHIDEFNGLSVAGNEIIKKFLELDFIHAVQVVHEQFTVPNKDYTKEFKEELKPYLKEYYGTEISDDLIKNWRQAVVLSQEAGKAILTFSDNPHEKGESNHGLWGMGTRYTWIKMEQTPNLESLRQALLLPSFRVKNDFECPNDTKPYNHPDQWIESISISNTKITDLEEPLHVEFSPQMNTIIGGRGSGKSSILRFLRGVFPKKVEELKGLDTIHKEFEDFFSLYNKRSEKGVLAEGTVIEIVFHRKGEKLKIVSKHISKNENTLDVFRFSNIKGDYEAIEEDPNEFIDLLGFDIFSQKQIYDIGTKTNSLRARIDEQVPEISDLKGQLKSAKQSFEAKSLSIRQIEERIKVKPALQTQIIDIENRIETFNKSGVSDLIKAEAQFNKDAGIIKNYGAELNKEGTAFQELINEIEVEEISLEQFSESHSDEIKKIAGEAKSEISKIKEELEKLQVKYSQVKTSFDAKIELTNWQKAKAVNNESFIAKKEELAEKGISDLTEIEREMKQLTKKKEELAAIVKEEEKLVEETAKKEQLKADYIVIRKNLTEERRKFLNDILKGGNVKAQVKPFRDFEDFEQSLRRILASETGYEDEITEIRDKWHSGQAEKNNKRVIDQVNDIQQEKFDEKKIGYGKRFINKIKDLNGQSIDQIDLLFPEDDIVIQYKTPGSSDYRSISTASAGQKTAAILTLLLSHGTDPLVLDQPEDDLDNYLIYDLVVEQLRRSKERRQVIVVTHNANIPVNGDSEHIVVMDTETKHIRTKEVGSVERNEIKNEICKVMEGGTDAFSMRAKRYSGLKKL